MKGLFKTYALPFWKTLLLLALLIILDSAANLINPHLVKYFIDSAISHGPFSHLMIAAALFFGIAFIIQLLTIWSTYLSKRVSWQSTNRLRTDLVRHCLHLNMDEHHQINPGDLTERIDGDVDALSNFFSNFFIIIMNNALLLCGILVVFFYENWLLGTLFTTFTVGVFLLISKFRGYATPHFLESREVVQKTYSFIEEKINGLEIIQKNGAVRFMMKKLNQYLEKKLYKERKAWVAGTFAHSVTMLTFTLGTILALTVGTFLFVRGSLSIGTIYLIYTYSQMLRTPIQQISQQYQDLQKASASVKRINQLLSQDIEKPNEGTPLQLGQLPPAVEFKDVSFGYKNNQAVIKNLSLKINPGEVMGVIGRTGSGKSTLAKLLTRFYDPQEGSIFFNGQNIREKSIASLRQNVAFVTQDVQLFKGTLRDNITLWNESISDGDILNALKAIGIWAWFLNQPDGLDTVLSPNEVSTGEGQLIALSRVFFKDPRVLILDEATSNLDHATERLVMQALEKLSAGRTVMIIAHRLNTLHFVDSIAMLEDGQIVEKENRKTLEENKTSRYSQLLAKGLEEVLA